ncbi:MAG TPA: hypothetical protein VMX76_02070 [Nevskiaceae bacterium]|nr:hypothetical protein [Nevskiaceae bacterium]
MSCEHKPVSEGQGPNENFEEEWTKVASFAENGEIFAKGNERRLEFPDQPPINYLQDGLSLWEALACKLGNPDSQDL